MGARAAPIGDDPGKAAAAPGPSCEGVGWWAVDADRTELRTVNGRQLQPSAPPGRHDVRNHDQWFVIFGSLARRAPRRLQPGDEGGEVHHEAQNRPDTVLARSPSTERSSSTTGHPAPRPGEKRKKELSKAVYGRSHTISLAEARHIYQKGAARLIIFAGQYGTVELSDEAARGVRKFVHAARRYSCRRPPSRSRRCT
jgi:hypothetical protein